MSPIPFNRFPGIDENNRFAAVVRQAIATSAELVAAFASKSTETNSANHIADKNNPHAVTKTQLGLGNVDNVSVLNDYIPKWKPNTAYRAGTAVISPFGEIVKSKTWHTSGTSFTATNWASVTNGDRVTVRGNYMLNPNAVGATTGFAAYTSGTGETGTTTLVAAAVDGPTPDITTYARWTTTAVKTSGSTGWRCETTAYMAPSNGVSGDNRTLDIWIRYTAPGGGTLNVTPRLSFYNGSTLVTTGTPGATVLLQSGQWTKLSVVGTATGTFTNVGWWVYSTTGANVALNATLDATGATVSTFNDDPFSGSTTNTNGYEYRWSGTANNSASYQDAVSNTSFVPRWKAGRAYSVGDQVVTPNNTTMTAKVAHTASSAFSSDITKWDGGDLAVPYGHAGRTGGFQALSGLQTVQMDMAENLKGGVTFDNAADCLVVGVAGYYTAMAQGYFSGTVAGGDIALMQKIRASNGSVKQLCRGSVPPISSDTCVNLVKVEWFDVGDKLRLDCQTGGQQVWGTDGTNGCWIELAWYSAG